MSAAGEAISMLRIPERAAGGQLPGQPRLDHDHFVQLLHDETFLREPAVPAGEGYQHTVFLTSGEQKS
jgi:hypothetical protein